MRLITISLLAAILLASCEKNIRESGLIQTAESATPAPAAERPAEPENKIFWMTDFFTSEESLNHNVFLIKKEIRKVKPKDLPEADVSDLAIQKNGKTVLKLEGGYYPLGNALDFGLFEFFGDGDKQLVVSSTIPRGGSHYVVNLGEKPKILFDSGSWGVGREDFGVTDVDGDGIYELFMESPEFYGFENFSSAETPLTTIYFKYDEKKEKFLPANHKHSDYALRNVESLKAEMNNRGGVSELARVLEITLLYIYAGKEKDAWSFFEREYKNGDAEAMKGKIRKILADEPVYQYIKNELRRQTAGIKS